MINVKPVMLCGYSGPPPLWLLSRPGFPKKFLSLTGNESLFEQAAQRLVTVGSDDIQVDKSLLVRNEEHCLRASEKLWDAGMERRRASLFNTDRIDHLYQGPHMPVTR